MSVLRKLPTVLRGKASEWEAAAFERERRRREEERQAAAELRARLQPAIDKIEEYLLDPAHWSPERDDTFHRSPYAQAILPADLVPDADRKSIIDTINNELPFGGSIRDDKGVIRVTVTLRDPLIPVRLEDCDW